MEETFSLLDHLIQGQRAKLLQTARRIVPQVIEDDLLQPNDFPALEMHPHFRHEEGILDGFLMVRAALLSKIAEEEKPHPEGAGPKREKEKGIKETSYL